MAGKGSTGSLNQENASPSGVGKWGNKVGKDRFLVQQQAFYVRGDVIVDIFQARGITGASSGDRNRCCGISSRCIFSGEEIAFIWASR